MELATHYRSTTDTEKHRFLGTVPQLREWGSGRLAKGLRAESYDVENLKYEATLEVDRDEVDDDQTGQIMIRVGELAQRAATHPDYMIAQLLMNGESSGYNAYDGLPFISASHVSGASGTQCNLLTAPAVDNEDPTTAEFKKALKAAISAMMAFRDDQGEPMMLSPDGLVCVVPPTMYFTALESVSAAVLENASNVIKGMARVISFPWFTDLSKWYLLGTAGVVRPFIFQERSPVEFGALTADSDEGFKREVYLFGVRARYRVAYGYWQYAVRTDFTGGS